MRGVYSMQVFDCIVYFTGFGGYLTTALQPTIVASVHRFTFVLILPLVMTLLQ